tara:strand:+ start:1228 stop:2205 length:978 start_codon:yes stop_codon:yes gene_type:complete
LNHDFLLSIVAPTLKNIFPEKQFRGFFCHHIKMTIKSLKIPSIFSCEICNYQTSNKKDYSKHLLTAKHKKMTFDVKNNNKAFQCECGKWFSYRQGLHRHKKICQFVDEIDNTPTTDSIVELIKQNTEFKQLILEQNKALQEQNKSLLELASKDTITNNNCVTNNQKFNLNFFLNTTCKDALNLSEFIEKMQVDFEDIENIGKNGYVLGMTDIILSRIKEMDITKRPLHCTDLKREIMYIKENDTWNKDTPNNNKLRKMINIVSAHNYGTIPLWRKKYPECEDFNNPKYEFSMSMMKNILGEVGEEQIKLDNKIIKNIAKHIIIEK